MSNIKDKLGNEFELGDEVVHPVCRRSRAYAVIKKVTRKENGKLYLDNSNVAIVYPDALINLTAYAWNKHLEIVNDE